MVAVVPLVLAVVAAATGRWSVLAIPVVAAVVFAAGVVFGPMYDDVSEEAQVVFLSALALSIPAMLLALVARRLWDRGGLLLRREDGRS